jgi:penicillin amidase
VTNLSPADRRLSDAYAAGVNAGLGSLNARPFEYLLLRSDPQPWSPEDSILVAFNMFLELNDERANRDIRRGLAHQVLPQELFDFLYPAGTDWDAPMTAPVPAPSAIGDTYSARADFPESAPGLEEEYMPGSNNWAIAGSRTTTGRAIVANDMHLGITTPNVFYRARLIVDGDAQIDLNGVTLPGVPLLIAGSNGKIAWGNTNSYGDWTDAVIVRPGSAADTYLTSGGERRFTTYTETIEVKGAPAEEIVVRETVWGPMVEDPAEPGSLFAISWLAHRPEAVNLRGVALESASSAAQALRIANEMGLPPQNFVVGDADGNIGWTIAGRIPVRTGFDPLLPADWSEADGWSGWLPPERYPRIFNPESGRIWTANARVVDGDLLAKIGDGGYDLGARASQIRDSLFAKNRFGPADMLPVQVDNRALFLARWRTLLLDTLDKRALEGDAERQAYRDLVEIWSARASVESAGYRLVRAFRMEVRERVFNMLMQPVRDRFGGATQLRVSNQFEAPLWTMIREEPRHLLTPEYESWRDLLLAAVDDNLRHYRESWDGPLSLRTWGERNTAAIRHPLSRAVPLLARWLDMPPDMLPGDSNMPRAQGPSFGASERFAVAPGDEANGYLHMPAGQSGHPLSPFYTRGHDDWVNAHASAFLPGDAVHSLTLLPAHTR